MRILTYNIHGWRASDGLYNLDRIADVIQQAQADIIGLNEVFHPRGIADEPVSMPGGTGSSAPSLLGALAERLGMHYVFGPCLRWLATDEMPENSYGNALLSRWPIVASAAHHLTPIPDYEQRGLLEGRILLPNGQPFTVYVTHLDHKSEENRLLQLRALRTWTVRDRNRPHLVLGDFNAISPWDYLDRPQALDELGAQDALPHAAANLTGADRLPLVIPQMEKAGYTDLYALFGQPGQRTFLPSIQPIRIDFIFASQSLTPAVTASGIFHAAAASGASDHLPVWADIELDG